MNKITQYIPLHLSIFLVLGVIFAYNSNISIFFLASSSIILLLFLVVFFYLTKKYLSLRWIFQIVSYLIIFLIGIFSISQYDNQYQKAHYSHYSSTKNTIVFQVDKTLKPSIYHDKYYAQILQIDSIICNGKILLNVAKDSLTKNLKIGETYVTSSSLSLINNALNPHTFDYNNYLKKQGVLHQITIKDHEILELSSKNNNLKILAAKLREKIQYSLQKHAFEAKELSIINAIVLGQRQNISKELLESYAGAGAIHILAVSGLHVGILFLLLSFLLSPLEKIIYGKHFKLLLIVLFLWGFAMLTGLSGSVVRAVTMFTFIAVGLTINNERSSVLHALITSFFFLILIHPLYLFDVGFQMSYAAVLGIVLLFPEFQKMIPRIKWLPLRKIWELFCVSITATIGTLPISLYYFHQFPGLFFLSNIVIVPFLGLIMGIGIFVVVLDSLHILPDLIVQLYGYILSIMNTFIEWVAFQEDFLFKNISFSIFALISSYLLIALLYWWWLKQEFLRMIVLLIAVLLFQSVIIVEKFTSEKSNEFIVFQKSRESIIGVRNGKSLKILHSLDSIINTKIGFINNYIVGQRLTDPVFIDTIPNVFLLQKHKILHIDSIGIYQDLSFKPDIVLLSQSPKINMERLVDSLKPQVIVADGSNYKSYVAQWRKTCSQKGIDFHYTGSDGAFIIESRPIRF